MRLSDNNKEWLDYDGLKVTVERTRYQISARTRKVIYPRHEVVLDVHAEMTEKGSPEYQAVRQQLGDAWSTDVLQSGDEFYCQVLLACRAKVVQPVNAKASRAGMRNLGIV